MLRPERMSRVSVTGSKRVMDEVIEAVHDLRLLHVTEYDGAWEGFDPGDPVEGADEASDKLVTVRALQSILGVTEEDAGPTRIVTDEALEEDLEEVRQQVNDLDDRRSDRDDDLRAVEERIDAVEPFVELGVDLDLLWGYDNLAVRVGEADAEEVREALAAADAVEAFEVRAEDDVVAAFAYPADAGLDDILVSVDFATVEVPEVDPEAYDLDPEGGVEPAAYLEALRGRKQRLESKLDTVESELEDLRLEVAGFLLAAEEKLAIEAQKLEAPLTFATTENAFVAEGWLPTERYADLETALQDALGDHVEVEELERADYDEHGHAHDTEEVAGERPGEPAPAAAESAGAGAGVTTDGAGNGTDDTDDTDDTDGGEGAERQPEARADGGAVHDRPMRGGDPPVVQENPGPAGPFELLVDVVNLPRYHELDPTVILWLTFPAFFGFMIGDVGYGLLYVAIGYWLWDSTDSDALGSLGGVALWSGGFTILFGFLYGEIFGLHMLGAILWGTEESAGLLLNLGHAPIEKGLSPATLEFAQLWLVVSLLLGVLHLTVGWIFGFVNDLSHGLEDAITENVSWLLLMFGVWVWIFSGAGGNAPTIMVGRESVLAEFVGFAGFSGGVGLAGLGVAAVGLVLVGVGEGGVGIIESLNVLVNVLSYTRIAAVLLAKAGMAFVVNLLFFGAYETHGEFHFMLSHGPEYVLEHHSEATVMFPGLIHSGVAALLFGLVVLVAGHLLVMALGITSAGLQSIRLEYVEFFQKFYQGGGKPYEPFGYEQTYTTED